MGKGKKVKAKGKKKHKPGKTTRKSSFYKIDGSKAEQLRRACPKCGAGVFMAKHKERHHCGKCSFTEFKRKP